VQSLESLLLLPVLAAKVGANRLLAIAELAKDASPLVRPGVARQLDNLFAEYSLTVIGLGLLRDDLLRVSNIGADSIILVGLE
jgi:hypothetical protein